MQVVLLAAGMGLRLGHLTRALPKAMIALNGKPLIDHTLPKLLASKRVEEVLVVGGFEHANLAAHVSESYSHFGDRIRVVENREFTYGNLFSMKAALPHLDSSFLVCNVDHVFSSETWSFILEEKKSPSIFCDFLRPLEADEMKVCLDEGKHLVEISKTLTSYDAGYVGLTFLPKEEIPSYQRALEQTEVKHGEKAVVENILPQLALNGLKIQVIAFDRYRWHEVDTKDDLKKAETALRDLEAKCSGRSLQRS